MTQVEHITREAMTSLLAPFGLCEAVKAGGLAHLGGQTGIDPTTHQLVQGGLEAQATQAFRNIAEVVALAGGRTENIVQLTWYLVERGDGASFIEDALTVTAARERVLPGLVAASTAVRVKALVTPEFLIEIAAVAAL